MSSNHENRSTVSPGIVARDYMNHLQDIGYSRDVANIDITELETRLSGVCAYDDIHVEIDICLSPEINPSKPLTIWTDGSIAKEDKNAIGGVGLIGLDDDGNVAIVGSVKLHSTERGMDILDIETIGVLLGVRISDDFMVREIRCDSKAVVNTINRSLMNNRYPVQAVWTKGHANDKCNNMADGLAKHGRHMMERELTESGRELHINNSNGLINRRSGWRSVIANGYGKPREFVFREDEIMIRDDASIDDIRHVHVYERQMTTFMKGHASQYIILHCDEDNNPISARRGVVVNPAPSQFRMMSTDFIMSRIPEGSPQRTLHLSGFIGDRYNIEPSSGYGKYKRKMFLKKLRHDGYSNIEVGKRLSGHVFNQIMNKSRTVAQNMIGNTMQPILNAQEPSPTPPQVETGNTISFDTEPEQKRKPFMSMNAKM